jgi:ArsR family transcriptional regulator
MVGYFKALADGTRLRIFSLLLRGELNVNEVVTVLALGQSRVSRHLKILSDSGLVKSRRDGLWVFYSASDQGPATAFIGAIRPHVEKLETFGRDQARIGKLRKESALQTSRFFDGMAADWSSLKKDILGRIDLASVLLPKMRPCRVAVDLGCGPGDILPVLKRRADLVIGVDNSPKMIQAARDRLPAGDGFDLRIGEMEHLPLRDGEADFVLMSLVLHHLAAPFAGVAEANRILKTGDTAVILDLAKHDDENLRKRFGDRWLGFRPAEVVRWLTEAGFAVRGRERIVLNKGLKADLFLAVKRKNTVSRAPAV